MHKFPKLNCLSVTNEVPTFPNDPVQDLRRALLVPVTFRPNIQEALQRFNFRYHRTCSFSSLLRECNVGEGQTFLVFWGGRGSDSHLTASMSASSCSSLRVPTPSSPGSARGRDLRSIAQQTEISCRYSPGLTSPVPLTEDESRVLRARLADSLAFGSPAPSLLPAAQRSRSILGSVCALLLNKQDSALKEVGSVTRAGGSFHDNICRICFGGESAERLVRPCGCRGTIAAVHRSCLERWLLQAATSYCELCRHHYVVTRSHKWSWARSVVEWARSGRARALAADAWRGAALGAASVLGTARALHACDAALQAGARRGGPAALAANLFSSLLIGVIGALNGLLTTWMLLKIQEHQLAWRAWRDSTLAVRVALASPHATPRASPHATPRASPLASPAHSASSLATVVHRATNIADPFMVAPQPLPDP